MSQFQKVVTRHLTNKLLDCLSIMHSLFDLYDQVGETDRFGEEVWLKSNPLINRQDFESVSRVCKAEREWSIVRADSKSDEDQFDVYFYGLGTGLVFTIPSMWLNSNKLDIFLGEKFRLLEKKYNTE